MHEAKLMGRKREIDNSTAVVVDNVLFEHWRFGAPVC